MTVGAGAGWFTENDPARKLTSEERALLEDLGYEVRQNMNGGDVVRSAYGGNFVACGGELAFVRKVGEENARALDATARLSGKAAGRAFRRHLELEHP